MIVEVTVRVLGEYEGAGDSPIAIGGSFERVVQVDDLQQNVLAAQAKVTELSDAARDAVVRQLREEGDASAAAPAPTGRPRAIGRRP